MITKDTKHGRIISYVDLSEDAVVALDLVMEAYAEASKREMAAVPLIPQGYYFQVYGCGSCVIVRECPQDEEDSE